MPTCTSHLRRLVVAALFALAAAAAPAVVALTVPTAGSSSPIACDSGEEEDVFTTVCTPFLIPNSPQGFTSTAANPDIPEVDGVPCTGRDSGACIGLSENQADEGPQPVPEAIISSSP